MNPLLRHPGLDPLWHSIRKDYRQRQLAAVGSLVLGIGLMVIGAGTQGLGYIVIGGLLSTLSLYWLYRLLREQPYEYWYETLADHPEEVVWLYGEVTERMPFGMAGQRMGTLYLFLQDGSDHSFGLPAEQLKLVTKTLGRLLPRAEVGYTEERELAYRGEILRRRGRDRW